MFRNNKGRSVLRPYLRILLVVIRPRICAEGGRIAMRPYRFSQYEQGGYLGSPDLSPAVFSTRDHRGADFALPRPAVNSTVPLGGMIRTHVLLVKEVLGFRFWVSGFGF